MNTRFFWFGTLVAVVVFSALYVVLDEYADLAWGTTFFSILSGSLAGRWAERWLRRRYPDWAVAPWACRRRTVAGCASL